MGYFKSIKDGFWESAYDTDGRSSQLSISDIENRPLAEKDPEVRFAYLAGIAKEAMDWGSISDKRIEQLFSLAISLKLPLISLKKATDKTTLSDKEVYSQISRIITSNNLQDFFISDLRAISAINQEEGSVDLRKWNLLPSKIDKAEPDNNGDPNVSPHGKEGKNPEEKAGEGGFSVSLLDLMRQKKEDMLKAPHPMKDDDKGARFAYLVGMAMVATVDGSIDPKEKKILLDRAIAMNLPEEDGMRAIEAAKTADDETVSSVLESLSEQRQRAIFMTDLRIMAHADGSLKSEECELWDIFGDMMEINQDDLKALSALADASLEPDEERACEAIAEIIKHDLDIPISAIKFFLPSIEKISLEDESFLDLCERSSSIQIKLAIALGADVNMRGKSRKTPLHYATSNKNPKVIETLIEGGADINAVDKDGATALHYGASNENIDIVIDLIRAGASVYQEDKDGATPLHYAARSNENIDVIAKLIEEGASVNAPDRAGARPLHYASKSNENVDIIIKLIEEGANINSPDKAGAMPLHYAAQSNEKVDVIAKLIEEGADLEAEDRDKATPLFYAARSNGNIGVITKLIETGASLEIEADNSIGHLLNINTNKLELISQIIPFIDKEGKISACGLMIVAMFNKNPEAIITLAKKTKVPIYQKDSDGITALHFAAMFNGNPKLIATLIEAGADPNAKTEEAGADPNAKTEEAGITPIHLAAMFNGNPKLIATLIEAGADPNAKTEEAGITPIHFAAMFNGNPKVIATLIEAGADPNAKAEGGITPLHSAVTEDGNPKAIATLIEAGADPNAKAEGGMTPLHFAAIFNGNPKVIATLIEAGADPNAKAEGGMTPLHSAAIFNGNPKAIAALIEAGADVNVKDERGDTPMSLAKAAENEIMINAFKKCQPKVKK